MGKVFLGMLMGIGLLVLGLVFIGFVITHSSSNGERSDSPAAVATSEAVTLQAISVTAPKLWADYHANEVAADNVYKGKRLIVQGQVASINKDVLDDIYALLSTPNEFEDVHANIRREFASEAATLRIGQIITVDCEGGGMFVASPFLKNCSIQQNALYSPSPEAEQEPQPQVTPASAESASASTGQTEGSNPIGDNVTAPTIVTVSPAEYSTEARANKLEGSVQLVVLVGENGEPQDVKVARSLGMGLDESATEAVKRYKFKPAFDETTGRTVPAQMSVNVQFRLN